MTAVAGLDVGGSGVKAWVVDGGEVVAEHVVPTTTSRPAPDRAELDPAAWEAAAREALGAAVAQAGDRDWAGVTAASLRQGFVLLDADGRPLGPGVLNSDGRGASHQHVLEGLHGLTGHWPAPQLTLPKLLHLREAEPERWAATRRVLFLHDWLLWLLCGEQATEASYACAGGMADVAARGWAAGLLERTGVGTDRLAPVVEAGTVLGRLRPGWGLPEGLPVVTGCGDTQLAALGCGGLGDGVVTVVAGSSTPVQAATAAPLRDPLARPWVSTHARADLWAAEGNAGYPGTFEGWWSRGERLDGPGSLVAVTAAPWWSPQTWSRRPPVSLVGLQPDTTDGDVRRALAEAHGYAVRGNVEDLERALGRPASAVVVAGGGAASLAPLLAVLLGRDAHLACGATAAARAGAHLVARALGGDVAAPGLPATVVPAGDPGPYEDAYAHWLRTTLALTSALG